MIFAGVGKTLFATSAPAPVVIQTEDGLGLIDAPTFGVLRSFEQLNNKRSHKWFRVFNEVSVLMFIAIVVLVVVKPF